MSKPSSFNSMAFSNDAPGFTFCDVIIIIVVGLDILFQEHTGVTVCPCMRFPCVIRSGYLVLVNQHTSSEGQGSRDLRQTRVEPY